MVRITAFLALVPVVLAAGPRLSDDPSPYIRAHAPDAIEWRTWGAETLEAARRGGRPLFVVVGRWGCRSCRARESVLAAPPVADLLRRRFVPVLVDRDARPEVAAAFSLALTLLEDPDEAWPRLAVTTPDARPVSVWVPGPAAAGGTVLAARLEALAQRFQDDRASVEAEAGALAARLRQGQAATAGPLRPAGLRKALSGLRGAFDATNGGWGVAPKALPHAALGLLLEEHERTGDVEALRMATRTLDALARGAVRDHLGGGFHAGAADAEWRLPRFEKTLADNALLLRAYVLAWEATESPVYREVAEGIAAWAQAELRDPTGAFWTGLDAEVGGAEGRFYLWTREEILEALGTEKGAAFLEAYRLGPPGVLAQTGPPVVGRPPEALLTRRAARPRPAADDRVMAGSNGLMIGALSLSGARLDRPEDVEAARRAANRALALLGPSTELQRCVRGEQPCGPAVLEDYAYLAQGLVDLHEATGEARWRQEAVSLADAALARFLDVECGGFFSSDAAHEPLLVRIKDPFDGALPSANGVMASVLWRLSRLTGQQRYAELARRTVEAFSGDLERAPRGLETVASAAGEILGPVEPGAALADDALPARLVRGPVTVEASLSSPTARAGELLEARVRLEVSKGWSVTAHHPLAKDLVGLAVSLPGDFMRAGPVRYPEGVAVRGSFTREPIAAVYLDEAEVVVPVRVPPRASPGLEQVRLQVRYQPCDRRSCKAPESVLLEVPFTVGPR